MIHRKDHLHAARVASAAFDLSGVAAKLYFKAHGRAYWERLIRVAASVGIHRDMPTGLDDIDRRITTTIDTRAVVDRKRAALHCNASQLDSVEYIPDLVRVGKALAKDVKLEHFALERFGQFY